MGPQFWRMLRQSRFEREMADELAFHIEQRTADLIETGLPPQEARRRARVEFGAAERIKDECRAAQGYPFLETLLRDIRYAVRGFRRSPGFVAVAVLSLAMAIGANTAIFSLLYDALFELLPVKHPRELVQVLLASPRGAKWSNLDYPEALPLSEPKASFAGTLTWTPREVNLRFAKGAAERVRAHLVSGNYYSTLGVTAYSGRTILPEDDRRGAPPVAVLSYAFWKSRLGSDPAALGQTLTVDGVPHTVVGITPPSFFGIDRVEAPDISVAVNTEPALPDMFYIVGRLKPGVSVDQARAELNSHFGRVLERYKRLLGVLSPSDRDSMVRTRVDLIPAGAGSSGLQFMFERPLRILLLLVAVILAIACVNVANLMLGRADARRREMSLRLALGASRGRLIRQSLTESVLLSGTGGALGLLFAFWLHHLLLAQTPFRNSSALAFRLNEGVLVFTAAVSVLCGIVFGLAPALRATRAALNTSLSGGTAGGTSRNRTGRVLIAVQVAASLVLLVGAALFVRTLYNLQTTDSGFDRDHLLVMNVDLRQSRFQGPRAARILEELEARVGTVPGVRSAAVADGAVFPLGGYNKAIWVEGYGADPNESHHVNFNTIGPKFFATAGVPVMLGRDFEPEDAGKSPEAAVVNEAMARKFYPNQNPLGRRFGDMGASSHGKYQIVGVVRDWRFAGLRKPDRPAIFHSLSQKFDEKRPLVLHARTFGDPAGAAAAIRKQIHGLDPNLVVYDLRTMDEQVSQTLGTERMFVLLSTLFGGLALGLSCVGLYGLTSYAVTRRTAEIAVRMAVGASRAGVVRLILRENLVPVLAGLLIGMPLALWTVRLARGMLFGIRPADPASLVAACLALAATTTLAGFLPALRAARLELTRALHYE